MSATEVEWGKKAARLEPQGREPAPKARQRRAVVLRLRRGIPRERRPIDTERGMTIEEMAEAQRRLLAAIPGPLYDLRDDEFSDW